MGNPAYQYFQSIREIYIYIRLAMSFFHIYIYIHISIYIHSDPSLFFFGIEDIP